MDEETRLYSPRSASNPETVRVDRSSLRNSAIWFRQKMGNSSDVRTEGDQLQQSRKTKLSERLQEMIVLEIRADG